MSLRSLISLSRLSSSEWSTAIFCLVSIGILSLLDVSQLTFMLIGGVAYAIMQALTSHADAQSRASKKSQALEAEALSKSSPWKQRQSTGTWNVRKAPWREPDSTVGPPRAPHSARVAPPVKPDTYKQSSNPVFAPKFNATNFDAEVTELVDQLIPGTDENCCLKRLTAHIKRVLKHIYPDVEVEGFVHSSVLRGTAFGVAVPEVDIVAYVNPEALVLRVRAEHQRRAFKADLRTVNKCATRHVCDRLVRDDRYGGGLKFRRSAFRGDEPRITLMVPEHLGFFPKNIPIDFSINATTPFYTAALLTECGQIDRRAKSLILLVKRWAKDRGICFAAKGHLSPYLWTLLVMYFLQVGLGDEGPLLPLLAAFKISSPSPSQRQMTSDAASPKDATSEECSQTHDKTLSVADLFCKFMQFYSQTFDWKNEAIALRSGKRTTPKCHLNIILRADGSTYGVGPSIEDPFKSGKNLADKMNEVALPRLHEELARANRLCEEGASLTEMLEPWCPDPTTADSTATGSLAQEEEED